MDKKEETDMLAKYIKEATDEGDKNIYRELMKEVLLQPKKSEEDSTITKIEKVQEVDPVDPVDPTQESEVVVSKMDIPTQEFEFEKEVDNKLL